LSAVGGAPATSPGRLLQLFRSGEASTRRELQDLTGLARSTVTLRLDALLRAGYLVEGGTGGPTGGRRAVQLTFDNHRPTVLTADLGATHSRLAVCTAAGEVLADHDIETQISRGPERVLRRVCDLLEEMRKESGRPVKSVCGVGLGVPGPVDHARERVVHPHIMPGWHDFPAAEFLRERLGVPACVDHDANVMALGEQRVAYPGAHSLLFVKVGTGIGSALVLDGTVFRGADGAEGDIGHAKIAGLDKVCACGARGCLASAASGGAIARDLAEQHLRAKTCRDVVKLAQRGEPSALKRLREASHLLGRVLATVISMVNPERLVVGGDIAHVHEHFLPGLRETLAQLSQPLAAANLAISASRLGDLAGTLGAAVMVTDSVFSADAVDARLEASGAHS
jgi:predicted NBD/HSP70 family sugar kinase